MCTAVIGLPGVEPRLRGRRWLFAGWAVLAMAARGRGRHRHGPPFGRGGPFGPFFGGGPGFPRGPRARRGDVRAAALLLLAEEPRNGYQIIQELAERSGGMWRPSPGSIYPALQQLEDEGLVRAQEQEGRRQYQLTDAGREYVAARAAEHDAPWDAFADSVQDDVIDLREGFKQVAIAFWQVSHAGSPAQLAEAQKVLAETRRALYRILAEGEPEAADGGGADEVAGDES